MQKDENSTAEIKKKTGNKIRQVTYTTARKWWGLSSYWNRCMRWNLCDNFNWRIHGCSSREADKKSREEGVKVGCFSSFLFNAVRKGWLYDSGEHFLVFVLWCVQLSTVVIFIFFVFFFNWKRKCPQLLQAHHKMIYSMPKHKTNTIKTKVLNKMCQMHPSVRGGFQGPCVGVLCRSSEWEERQVNTWCQRERRSPYLSFFASQCRWDLNVLVCFLVHISACLLFFLHVFFKGVKVCVCVCALNPL